MKALILFACLTLKSIAQCTNTNEVCITSVNTYTTNGSWIMRSAWPATEVAIERALSVTGPWQEIGRVIAEFPHVHEFEVFNVTNNTVRLYRLKIYR